MMKNIYLVFIALLITAVTSCQKDVNPYITKAQVDKIDSIRHPAIKNVAFIYNNEVYFLADFTSKPQKITNNGSTKKFIRMSHDHTKFAYKNLAGSIDIVDKTGKLLASLTQYNDIRNFDWSADDKTLYIINSDNVAFYGPAMKVPGVIYFTGYYNFISAAVSKNGDLVYLLRKYNFDALDQYEMVIRKASGGDPVFYRAEESGLPPMATINFAANGLDMVLGFEGPGDDVSNVYLFDNMAQYPTYKLGFNSISTPAYQSNIKYMLGAFDDDSGSHLIGAVYLDTDIKDNNKTFAGYAGVKYLDWK
ncbi:MULTISPECIES: hypothetical protein [unclassified Mucilaginibacter]|jgi:hypothetical protein|uniref:hypothetical protein n=1 Tax=unclassified Mucilaginibacter TaxID=2617802 RepID=UPI0008B10A99|nr:MULTISPECIES: hypothetical protein [unclassified Mucilaginibacter]WDF79121.1 hypothetical protein PQ469_03750 [Mucilaginibacter sp. KACC 22773]SEO45131.1 hypothetical protein SAMN05428947_102412 [Mucilaginibacter sp. OK283]